MPLLEGHVGKQLDEKYDRVLRDLQLARQLVADKEAELVKLRGEYQRLMTAVQYLREQLEPLHIGLSAIFGQIDLVSDGIPQSSTRAAAHPPTAAAGANPKWESWKQKFPGRPAEMIDLLLVHGEMTTAQLVAALKCRRQAVYEIASKLGQAGLMSNSDGKYRLREI
jgi:hypothetical protein